MKRKLCKEIKNYTIKFMSGVCITTILMNSDSGSNITKSIPVPASKPSTIEEPLLEKKQEIDAELLGFLDLADITKDYIEDISVKTISLNNVEKVVYYYVDTDNNNNWTYIDFEIDEPIMYSKSKENNDVLYGSEYIDGDIKLLSQDSFKDYFKKQTGKDLDRSKTTTKGDLAKIKRLLDKGNTIYLALPIEKAAVVQQFIDEGIVKPASLDYSIDDYTTTPKVKIKTN